MSATSANGTFETCRHVRSSVALGGKADIAGTIAFVAIDPERRSVMRRYVSYTRVEDRIFSLTNFRTHFSNPFNDPQPI